MTGRHVLADEHNCGGEDRADPDSWDDPDICEAWAAPPEIEPERPEEVGR